MYVTGTWEDDLLGKVRHEEVVLILVRHNDAFEVITSESSVPGAAQKLGTHVDGVDYNDVRGLVSNDPHLHTERKKPNECVVQRKKMKHSEYVNKPQEDQPSDVAIVKALSLRHLGDENRVCHIFLAETPRLYR